jgi:hypothetical protein
VRGCGCGLGDERREKLKNVEGRRSISVYREKRGYQLPIKIKIVQRRRRVWNVLFLPVEINIYLGIMLMQADHCILSFSFSAFLLRLCAMTWQGKGKAQLNWGRNYNYNCSYKQLHKEGRRIIGDK